MSHPFDGIVPAGTTRRSWLRCLFGAVAGLFAWRTVRAAAPPRPERLPMPTEVQEKRYTTLMVGEEGATDAFREAGRGRDLLEKAGRNKARSRAGTLALNEDGGQR